MIVVLSTCSTYSNLFACAATSTQNIVTGQYDSFRSGENLDEDILTPATVNSSQFGYLFSLGVASNPTYAQPLVIHNLELGSTSYCTALLVATMDNYIYIFDGDNPPTAQQPYLWKSAQYDGPPAPFCVAIAGFSQVGIVSTPEYDSTNGLLYFVTATDTTSPAECGSLAPAQNWVYTLHSISLKHNSGFGGDYFPPVVIGGSVSGTGDNTTTTGCANGVLNCVPFVASEALQRPALLDLKGTIYIGFGYGTTTAKANEKLPYHGWLFGYKSCATGATNCASPQTAACFARSGCGLQQVSIFNSTANSHGGGIWMSGRGPAANSNGVFFSVGNSCMSGQDPALCTAGYGGTGYGESVMNLVGLDFFAPTTVNDGYTLIQTMNYNDLDMGSGGVLAVPPSNPGVQAKYLIAGDKIGNAYLLNTSALGGATPAPYQTFLATTATATCPGALPIYPAPSKENGCAAVVSPAFWTRGTTGYLYIWGQNDTLRAFPYSSATSSFNVGAAFTSANPIATGNGGVLAISAESPTNAVNAILWAVTGNSTYNQGTLQAYQLWSGANPVLNKLWSSDSNGTNYFTVQRFIEPLVSNGKVYVTTATANASGNYSLWVYGLCSEGPGGVCGSQPGSPNN